MLRELRDLARLKGSARSHLDEVRSIVIGLLAALALIVVATVFLFALGVLRWAAEFGALGWIAVVVVLALSVTVGILVWANATGRLKRPVTKTPSASGPGEAPPYSRPMQIPPATPKMATDPTIERERKRICIDAAISEGRTSEAERLIAALEQDGSDTAYVARARHRLKVEARLGRHS